MHDLNRGSFDSANTFIVFLWLTFSSCHLLAGLNMENTQIQSFWNKVGGLKKTIASKEKEIKEVKESLEKLCLNNTWGWSIRPNIKFKYNLPALFETVYAAAVDVVIPLEERISSNNRS